ncbi:MAG: hypothetical protein Kow0070_22230 [Anaerolineales bacterium]
MAGKTGGVKRDWLLCLALFLVVRLIASFLGYTAAVGPVPEPLSNEPINATAETLLHQNDFSHRFINIWKRWDTDWYLKIAAFGYDLNDGTVAYMPLYPWLTSRLASLTGDFLLSALLISNLAALAVFLLFYEVARIEGLTKEQAVAAVVSLAAFPSAFFLLAAYTDSVYLAFTLGAWLSARRHRWFLAGTLGAFATLTRLQGSLLTPILGLLWLREIAGVRWLEPATWRKASALFRTFSWMASLFPALAFLGWNICLNAARLGNITGTLNTHWGIRTVPPWTGIGLFLQRLFNTPRVFVDYIDLGSLTVIVMFLIFGLRRLDPILSIYSWLNLALFFMRGTPPHLLDSFSRYMLVIFPAFLVLGGIPNRAARLILWGGFFCLQLFLLMGFLDWRWVA